MKNTILSIITTIATAIIILASIAIKWMTMGWIILVIASVIWIIMFSLANRPDKLHKSHKNPCAKRQ